MTSIHTSQLVSPLDTQRRWPQFDHIDSPPITAHREVLLSQLYMRQPQSRFRARMRELIAADRQKDESLAILLHELRSPLASIQNAVAALRKGSKNETFQKHMHELIERQVRQIGLLASSLCQLRGSSLENLQIQRERTDLCSVLASAAETVTPDITQRQHHLVIGLPETSIWILGDAGRLEEVFVNLLSNASKYSNVGGRITMSMHVSDGHAVVQVRDSGIGIAADSLPYIFDLFVRADTTAVRTRAGLGIGLALVRSIVNSHGGTVSAASAGIGQGSIFTVRLQLER